MSRGYWVTWLRFLIQIHGIKGLMAVLVSVYGVAYYVANIVFAPAQALFSFLPPTSCRLILHRDEMPLIHNDTAWVFETIQGMRKKRCRDIVDDKQRRRFLKRRLPESLTHKSAIYFVLSYYRGTTSLSIQCLIYYRFMD